MPRIRIWIRAERRPSFGHLLRGVIRRQYRRYDLEVAFADVSEGGAVGQAEDRRAARGQRRGHAPLPHGPSRRPQFHFSDVPQADAAPEAASACGGTRHGHRATASSPNPLALTKAPDDALDAVETIGERAARQHLFDEAVRLQHIDEVMPATDCAALVDRIDVLLRPA